MSTAPPALNAVELVRRLDHPRAAEVAALADAVAAHRVFTSLRRPEDLRTFMQHHVWAVWDFMSLLKSVQAVFCPTTSPWLPSRDPDAARLVGEIVVGEEADDGPDGACASHFEIYVSAMTEAGADTRPIRGFISALRNLADWQEEIDVAPAPAREFVRSTMRFVDGPPWVRVAAFAVGRESVIPAMFHPLALELAGAARASRLRWYLERHLHVDAERHGPLTARLFERVCLAHPTIADESLAAAAEALRARAALWDGVVAAIG